MADGRHESLSMRSAWKHVAERADRPAFTPDEACKALLRALQQDWKAEVPWTSRLQLDQLARLHRSVASQSAFDRQVGRLSASLGLPEETVRAKLMRVLQQHECEWKGFLDSLRCESFASHWALEA